MPRTDKSKLVFWGLVGATLCSVLFVGGMYSAAKKNAAFRFIEGLKETISQDLSLLLDEVPTLIGAHPSHFLQPSRRAGEGVTVNAKANNDLVLLSGFFDDENQIRLLRRDGTLVAHWPLSFSELFPNPTHVDKPPATDWNIDTHGALILPDGSVVFNFEYGGLVKLDRCGDVVWTVKRPTHHSLERAEGGGFWVPGRSYVTKDPEERFPAFRPPFKEDTIMKISDDGRILMEKSLVEILYANDLEAVLTANGDMPGWRNEGELVHLNKITELPSNLAEKFPAFSAGDLVLSMRDRNWVVVLDPETEVVKWSRIGPWLRQHDPEFSERGTIVVFNNNFYGTAYVPDSGQSSNILELDPSTDIYRVLYGDSEDQSFASLVRGKVELTNSDGLLITEFGGGRVFETDSTGNIVWEYINRYSSDEVAEITEGRLYPNRYFEVADWSCPI